MNIKYKKSFTLIETLLSLSILLLIGSVSIFYINTESKKTDYLEEKIINYIVLNRYIKCYAEIGGNKGKIILNDNKLNVILEDIYGNITNIPVLNPLINNINDNTRFECQRTNIITYLPDGFIEKTEELYFNIKDIETNWIIIKIDMWNNIQYYRTNSLINMLEE